MPVVTSTTNSTRSARRRGRLGLLRDLGLEDVAGFEPAPGVDDVKADAAPLDFDGLAVARDAAVFFDHGHALAGETIDERTLADVGSSDDDDLGLSHAGHKLGRTDVKRRAKVLTGGAER
jgi:hypothetical protein